MRIASNIVRRLAVGAFAAVSGVTIALSAAAPASAQETFNGNCESGELCMYYGTDLAGYIADMYDNVADYSGWHFYAASPILNDNTESAKSNSIWSVACVSENANYGGKMFWRGDAGDSIANFGQWKNKASSHRFRSACAYN